MSTYMDHVQNALSCMEAGGVVLAQLDVAYALLCTTNSGLKKIFELKNRPANKPMVCLGDKQTLDELLLSNERGQQFASLGLPIGLVGASYKRNPPGLEGYDPELFTQANLFTGGETISVFVNMGDFASELVHVARAKGVIVIGSSANVHGAGNHFTIHEVEETIRANADYIVDLGPTKYQAWRSDSRGMASTMVNIDYLAIEREGFFYERFEKIVRRKRQRERRDALVGLAAGVLLSVTPMLSEYYVPHDHSLCEEKASVDFGAAGELSAWRAWQEVLRK